MLLVHFPVWVFHSLMQRSAVPPPEASTLDWKGHHASALTAAVCSLNLCRCLDDRLLGGSQTHTRLSLPPLASRFPEPDHLSPHTSEVCPWKRDAELALALTGKGRGVTKVEKQNANARSFSPVSTDPRRKFKTFHDAEVYTVVVDDGGVSASGRQKVAVP